MQIIVRGFVGKSFEFHKWHSAIDDGVFSFTQGVTTSKSIKCD